MLRCGEVAVVSVKKYLLLLPVGLVGASIGLNFLVIGMFAWTYAELTEEVPIVVLEFTSQGMPQVHEARLTDALGNPLGVYPIYGDQWRIDAKFMKMKYWANLLGLESRYALDRLEGRYRSAAEQNTRKTQAHDLGEGAVIESVALYGWNPFLDTEYGSSAYKDIAENVQYVVLKTPTGLMVRENPLAVKPEEKANGDGGFFSGLFDGWGG